MQRQNQVFGKSCPWLNVVYWPHKSHVILPKSQRMNRSRKELHVPCLSESCSLIVNTSAKCCKSEQPSGEKICHASFAAGKFYVYLWHAFLPPNVKSSSTEIFLSIQVTHTCLSCVTNTGLQLTFSAFTF